MQPSARPVCGFPVFRPSRILLAACAVLCVATGVQGSLLTGKTIHVQWLSPNMSTILNGFDYDYVVGSDKEIENIVGTNMDVDFFDTSILFSFDFTATFSYETFNGIRIEDRAGNVPDFMSASYSADPGTTLPSGFDASRISYDANNIYVNFRGIEGATSRTVRLDVVPEPALIFPTLLGVGVYARLRRRHR